MPVVTDYNTLSQKIADYTHRSDLYAPSGGTFITDYFLQDAQIMINKDIFDKNSGNGIQLMEAFYSQSINNGIATLPAGYIAPKYFKIADSGGNIFLLGMKDPQWIYANYPIQQATDLPAFIARDMTQSGSVFIFGPYPDSNYTVSGTYYQSAPLLNQSNTTNWMVTSAPDMFFAAAMKHAMLYLRDSEGAALWDAQYQSLLMQLIEQDKSERWGSATMQIDIA